MKRVAAIAVVTAGLLASLTGPAFAATPPTSGPDSTHGTANGAGKSSGKDGCIKALKTRANDMRFKKAPAMGKPANTWRLQTNCGLLTVKLLPSKAPENVNSIKFLSKRGFYDRTSCHRLTTEGIFVLQCGDPAGDSTGGPGYTVPDENFPPAKANNYPAGTVAMANAGPGTAGSQFFFVYKNTTLPASYSIIGKLTPASLKRVQAIAAHGAQGGSDGPPRQPVTVVHAYTGR